MLSFLCTLLSALVLTTRCALAIDVDLTNETSIKAAAATIAGGVIDIYGNSSVINSTIPGLFPNPYYFWESGLVSTSVYIYYRTELMQIHRLGIR
jgi:mannan endo-1,6-alpha-mannosidase